jgi:hypothetical protein
MPAGASSGDEFWHESDLRKITPVLLSFFDVRLYCLCQNAWLKQFGVSHDAAFVALLNRTLQDRLTTPLSARFLTVLCQQAALPDCRQCLLLGRPVP